MIKYFSNYELKKIHLKQITILVFCAHLFKG